MNWNAIGAGCSIGTLVLVARLVFSAGIFKQRFLTAEKLGEENAKGLKDCGHRLNGHDTEIKLLRLRTHRGGFSPLHAESKS